jgi:excisionase family DNA binding protein
MHLSSQTKDLFPENPVSRQPLEEPSANAVPKKSVGRAVMPPEQRLLVDRYHAAQYLSISQRSLDYLVAHGELKVRRIGSRVLIPLSELQRYARTDHERIAG